MQNKQTNESLIKLKVFFLANEKGGSKNKHKPGEWAINKPQVLNTLQKYSYLDQSLSKCLIHSGDDDVFDFLWL